MQNFQVGQSLIIICICAGVFAPTALAEAGFRPVSAADKSKNITLGYRDGYWDSARNWHWWEGGRDLANYKTSGADAFHDWNYATATVSDGAGRGKFGRRDNVAYAYRDGFWDFERRWHSWKDSADRKNYRKLRGGNFSDWNHDRDGESGWRD